MTSAFRSALLVLGVLLLVTAGVWIWKTGDTPAVDLEPATGREAPDGSAGPDLAAQGGAPSLEGAGGRPTARPGAAEGLRPGLRQPSGVDLSDPAQRKAHLDKLLAERPVRWDEVGALLALMEEPIDPAVRALLIETLRVGDRNGALTALSLARDPALIPDLFAVVDDPAGATGARRVALQVLGRMPAGERDGVVKELEARLKAGGPADAEVLYAISGRGGAEAMRAVSEYVLRAKDGQQLAQTLVGRFDLQRDVAAQAVLVEALGRAASPDALETLVRIAAQPGANGLAAPLIALDRDDQPLALREKVFESLAQIGSGDAVGHLLKVSRQPGQFGERATLALAQLPSATPEAREALVQELERSGLGPRPEQMRSSLLEALGRLRVESAIAPAAAALRDGSERVRNSALRSLQGQGERARAHVPEVSGLFDSGSAATRIGVVNALAALGGPEAQRELEALARRTDLTPSLKRTVDVALGELTRRSQAAADGD